MKKQFITYYSDAVKEQLESGKKLEDVEVDFRLSVLKPLHACSVASYRIQLFLHGERKTGHI